MSNSLNDDLFEIRELVLAAGAMLLESMGRIGPVQKKGGTELLTALDRRVEDFLLAGLAQSFPGERVLAEESGHNDGQGDRIWYVDPLDGTTNYAHGYPFFSVSVGCADETGLLLGAVFAPYLDELYLAAKGGGAVMERPRSGNSQPLGPRQKLGLDQALLATGFPYVRDEDVDRNVTHVRNFLKAGCHGVRRGGSAALDLVHVAAGKLDGYWELNLRPWDSAAGTIIAREVGVLVTDFSGLAGRLHYESILAAAPGLHDEMVEMLARPFQPGGFS